MELLQNTLIATATQDEYDTGDYSELRRELLERKDLKSLIPEYIFTCRNLSHFWQFIKNKFAHNSTVTREPWDVKSLS
jgi:hypothetical protein